MAGSWPDAPSRRMAWDADGTVLLSRDRSIGAAWTEAGSADRVEMNDEDNVNSAVPSGGGPNVFEAVLIFPELREIDGIYGRSNGTNDITDVDDSADTTNGLDGTFGSITTDYDDSSSILVSDTYRDEIFSTARSNKRAIRFEVNGGNGGLWRAIHLYGEISAGETPDRLLWIDEITGLEFSLPIDYGDVPRGSARDRKVRLKNNSGSLTANTLQITAEALFGGSGDWYTFDVAGGGFASTNSDITSLGSGATSGLITIRQIIPDSETLGTHVGRAYVNVASWS